MKKPTSEQLLKDTQSTLTWADIASKYNYTDARYLRKLAVRYGLPPRREILKPSKEKLTELLNSGLNIYQISEALGYSKGGWSNVYAICRQYGLTFDFHAYAEEKKVAFTDRQLSFIYGTLLGDGCLNKCGTQRSLVTGHSMKQADYLYWKVTIMSNYIICEPKRNMHEGIGGLREFISYHTLGMPALTSIYHECYPENKKTVSQEWLDKIDEFALAVWYMDDGSRNKRYGTLTFCTNGFSYSEHEIIVDWFEKRWGIPCVIENRRNHQFSIRINARHAPKLLALVRPHVPSCMSYKLGE